jgi:hypothetical protein
VDFNTGEERKVVNLEANCLKLTLTAKHLITSLENSKLKWYLAIMADENKTSKQKGKDKVEVICTDFKDEVTREFELENGPARWVSYTKNYKKLVIGSTKGHISLLPIEGEIEKELDEQSDNDDKQ